MWPGGCSEKAVPAMAIQCGLTKRQRLTIFNNGTSRITDHKTTTCHDLEPICFRFLPVITARYLLPAVISSLPIPIGVCTPSAEHLCPYLASLSTWAIYDTQLGTRDDLKVSQERVFSNVR